MNYYPFKIMFTRTVQNFDSSDFFCLYLFAEGADKKNVQRKYQMYTINIKDMTRIGLIVCLFVVLFNFMCQINTLTIQVHWTYRYMSPLNNKCHCCFYFERS